MAELFQLGQENEIKFVMANSDGLELQSLTLTILVSKPGTATSAAAAGSWLEISGMVGWYRYVSPAAEAAQRGSGAIQITASGAAQQNLEYVVQSRNLTAVAFTYTVTRSDNSNPIEGANVEISTDSAGDNVIWTGVTDALGVARDTANNEKPYLDPGTYYFWVQHSDFSFDNPDTEVVS